jgi:hypothetical protein
MRLYFCYALLAFLGYLSFWRPVLLKKKFPIISVSLCAVLLAFLGWQEMRWQFVQTEGSRAVRSVSLNKEGTLRCQRFSEAFFDINTSRAGMVSSARPNEAVVNYEQCLDLMDWMSGDKKSATPKQVQALHVLTHEAVHVSKEYNEAVTECTAMNRDYLTVQALGGSKELMSTMPQQYYKEFFPRMSSEYTLPGCLISPEFDSVAAKQKTLQAPEAATKK